MRLLMVLLCWVFPAVAVADLPREKIYPGVDVAPEVIKGENFRNGTCEKYLGPIREPARGRYQAALNIIVRNDLLTYVGDYRNTELEAVFKALKAQGMTYSKFLPELKTHTPSIPNILQVFSSPMYSWQDYVDAERYLNFDDALSLYPELALYTSCRAALIATDRVNMHSFAQAFSIQAQSRKVYATSGPIQVEVFPASAYWSMDDDYSPQRDNLGRPVWVYYLVTVSFTNTDSRAHTVTAGRLAIRNKGKEQTFRIAHINDKKNFNLWDPVVPAKSSMHTTLIFPVPASAWGELYWLPGKEIGGGALWAGSTPADKDIGEMPERRLLEN